MIMHVDANSFYASCERLFRPDLQEKPIVVLSNNDGIIVALNSEAKELGFSRGDPFFKVRAACREKGVAVFSSNYTLYSDISARLTAIYNRLCPEVEVYSIDEAFLFFRDYKEEFLGEIGTRIRETAKKEVGIPVSVGIAPTKTLTKICNKIAKKRDGVCASFELDLDSELSHLPVADIWGIGYAKSGFLVSRGIRTALDLKHYPLDQAKKHLTITGFRTVQELNGISASGKTERERRDNIGTSKSFFRAVDNLEELETALAAYTHEAVSRLRADGSSARYISVFIMTNAMSLHGPPMYNQVSAEFPFPTSFLPEILDTAKRLLRRIYKPGYRYRKIVVYLLGLEPDMVKQPDLFLREENRERNQSLMSCFDEINRRYGRGSLFVGTKILKPETDSKGRAAGWTMQRHYLSPEYTTKLSDIPVVY